MIKISATIDNLQSAISLVSGERDKARAEIDRLTKVLENTTRTCKTLEGSMKGNAKDHLATIHKRDKAEDSVIRRNLVIIVLSLPYLYAVIKFIVQHLSVSIV